MRKFLLVAAMTGTVAVGCNANNDDPTVAGTVPDGDPSVEHRHVDSPARPVEPRDHKHAAAPRHHIARTDPLFSLLNHTRYNEPKLSVEELTPRASLIVRGSIVSVVDGRTIDFIEGPSHPLHTAVLRIRIAERMKGDHDEVVDVEYIRGGIPVEDLSQAAQQTRYNDMVLFLTRADTWNTDVHKFTQGDSKVDSDELHQLVNQSGLMIAVDNRVVQPLQDGQLDPFEGSATSLDELEGILTP